MDIDGMTFWVSSYGMLETVQRLRDAVPEQGMSVVGHIDHGQAAAAACLELRPLAWCMDQGCRRIDTNPVRGQAMRT